MTNIDTQETDYSVYILACLSANVVIGIINEQRKLWNLHFSALESEPSSVF